MGLLDLFRRKKVSLEHPDFGLLSLESGKNGSYWMCDAYKNDELAISIETTGNVPPTEEQVAFFKRITNDPDALFRRVSEHLGPRYQEFFRSTLPTDWRAAFRLGGIGIPLNGLESNPWDVSFECLTNNSGFLFTCYFVGGHVEHVGVDT